MSDENVYFNHGLVSVICIHIGVFNFQGEMKRERFIACNGGILKTQGK